MTIDKIIFADRLYLSLDHAGFPRRGKGLQAAVSKEFKVTQASVSQWLRGDSLPDTEKLLEIAKRLEVSMEWLLGGKGESIREQGLCSRKTNSPITGMQLPILNWEEAGHWQKTVEKAKTKTKKSCAWTNLKLGSKAYALIVENDELLPEYRKNTVLIIDPTCRPHHGEHVVYLLKNEKRVTCKKLIEDGKLKYLARFKPSSPDLLLRNRDKFCGVVCQAIFTFG